MARSAGATAVATRGGGGRGAGVLVRHDGHRNPGTGYADRSGRDGRDGRAANPTGPGGHRVIRIVWVHAPTVAGTCSGARQGNVKPGSSSTETQLRSALTLSAIPPDLRRAGRLLVFVDRVDHVVRSPAQDCQPVRAEYIDEQVPDAGGMD